MIRAQQVHAPSSVSDTLSMQSWYRSEDSCAACEALCGDLERSASCRACTFLLRVSAMLLARRVDSITRVIYKRALLQNDVTGDGERYLENGYGGRWDCICLSRAVPQRETQGAEKVRREEAVL